MKTTRTSTQSLCVALALLSGAATAQTLTTLHSFPALDNNDNSDGANPDAGLIVSGNTLYGTAGDGGAEGNGTVFAINTDGSGFKVLYTFSGFNNTTGFSANNTNSDGASPNAGLILSGDTLYGTATAGGDSASGTVFAINTNGTGFTTLYNFAQGSYPAAGLVLSGNTLYGTTEYGGDDGWGTVFALNTDGTGFATLYSFTGGNDGSAPNAGLVSSVSTLYSTTVYGGVASNGTVFAINTDGSGFTVLHSFSAETGNNPTNSDGALPYAGLVLSDGVLYGAATQGGNTGHGTVFSLTTSGADFKILHDFTTTPLFFNSDGALPYGALVLSGSTLYGTAKLGGKYGLGTVFSVSTSGDDFRTLSSLGSPLGHGTEGGWAYDGLVLSDNALFGTANVGGTGNVGTVFRVSLGAPPPPPKSYLITAEASPLHSGEVSGGGSYQSGSSVTLTAASDSCYEFTRWTVGGKTVSSNADYTFVVGTAPQTVVADFAQFEYVIDTASAPPEGGTTTKGGVKGCGSVVTLTATPKAGFRFTNWVANGVIQGEKPTLKFTVDGVATITANFVDVAPPTLVITSPLSGSKTTNAAVTLKGTARDNAAVAAVYYQVDASGIWARALTTNNWTNWNAQVPLSAGLNVVEAYAEDTSGNTNKPVSVKITHDVSP